MSKTIPENLLTISDRINKVLTDKGLVKEDGTPNYAEAERLAGIKGTVLSKVVQRNGSLGDYNKEKFLRTFHVTPSWFDAGVGNIYDENHTQVDKTSDNSEKEAALRAAYKTVKEGNTEYVLIPMKVLDKTQLVSIEELAEKNRELERKNGQIDFYQNQIGRLLENLELTPKPANTKKSKE